MIKLWHFKRAYRLTDDDVTNLSLIAGLKEEWEARLSKVEGVARELEKRNEAIRRKVYRNGEDGENKGDAESVVRQPASQEIRPGDPLW